MKQFSFFILATTLFALISCNRKTAIVYYHDNTQVDDGNIFGENLSAFFLPDKYIYSRRIHSSNLKPELRQISDSLSLLEDDSELDDGYYGYAFITSTKDTLYASYSLNYWKISKKSKPLVNEKVKVIMKQVFKNPYLK